MTSTECIEILKPELKALGFKKERNYWSKNIGEITFVVNIQKSQFEPEDYCCNFGISVQGYNDGGMTFNRYNCQFWKRINNSSWKTYKMRAQQEENPEAFMIVQEVQQYLSDCSTIDLMKNKFRNDSEFQKGVYYGSFRSVLDPTYVPKVRVQPDYTKEENLIKMNITYNLVNDVVYVGDRYYSINEEMWKNFAKRKGYKLKVLK